MCDIGTCINKLYGRWVNNCEFIGMNKMVVNVWLLSASTATTVIFREWARARTTKRKRHGKDERIGEHAYKISFNWKFLLYAVFSVFFRWIIVTSFRLQRKRTHKAAHTIRRRSMNVSNTVTKTQMVDNKLLCVSAQTHFDYHRGHKKTQIFAHVCFSDLTNGKKRSCFCFLVCA